MNGHLTVLVGEPGTGKSRRARAMAGEGRGGEIIHFEGLEDNKAAIYTAMRQGRTVVVCTNHLPTLDRFRALGAVVVEEVGPVSPAPVVRGRR